MDIYEPARDFRLSPTLHQQFELAFLVERDLGAFKQWPLIVDEAIRLLSPGGILVLRARQETFASMDEIVGFIWTWTKGRLEVIARHVDGSDFTFGFRLTTSNRRAASAVAWSFGLITCGNRSEQAAAFVANVLKIRPYGDFEAEILVSGPPSVRVDLGDLAGKVKFVPAPRAPHPVSWLAQSKNLVVAAADGENIVIATDGIVPRADFAEAVHAYGGDFDIIVPGHIGEGNQAMPDWVATSDSFDWTTPGWLDHGDYHPFMYPGDAVVIGKTSQLSRVRWNEALEEAPAQQVEIARRLRADGVTFRLARNVVFSSEAQDPLAIGRFQRIPWIEDNYVDPQPRKRKRAESAYVNDIASDLDLDLAAIQMEATKYGLVLSRSWQKTPLGFKWVGDGEPTISCRLKNEQANDIRLIFAFTTSPRDISAAKVNGCVLPAHGLHFTSTLLQVTVTPKLTRPFGNVHLQLQRIDPGKEVVLRNFTTQGVFHVPNCTFGIAAPLHLGPDTILSTGWNQAEEWGVWAARAHADLDLRLPQPPDGDLRITISLQMALMLPAEAASVAIILNGIAMTTVAFSASASRQDVELAVPASAAADARLSIGFVSNRVIPASRSGVDEDTRRLGVGLLSVTIDEVAA